MSFRVWLPALKGAGLKPLRIHDLRHTCASLLIAQGHSPKSIQAHLGHSSIVVTLDVYGHLYPEEREKIAVGLEATYQAARGSGGLSEPPRPSGLPRVG